MTESQNTKLIPLTQGKFAIVDEEDFERVSCYRWCANKINRSNLFYAVHCVWKGKKLNMSNLVMHSGQGVVIDHINHDTLDNRKNNLRVVDAKGNAQNHRKLKKKTSKYKGVSFDTQYQKWRAQINPDGKSINLGRFLSEKDAALAYDKAARSTFKECALLNSVLFTDDFTQEEPHDRYFS